MVRNRTCEWVVYDKKKQEYKFTEATNWKDALEYCSQLGVLPRRHYDIRPKDGQWNGGPVTEQEFQSYLNSR